jgi:3-deoxy-D-manno-octulosonic-acid transferase
MRQFWVFLYRFLVLPALWVVLQSMGLVSRKIRRGIAGRHGLFQSLQQQVDRLPASKRVWFHSSSLGEFEQAKPIIAELKRRHPDLRVIASFFSPSGYEHSKRYHLADVVTYLPFDTRTRAMRFLDLIRPDIAVMVRYDVWPNHIWELQRRGIPTMLANATMRRQTKRRFPLVRTFHHYVYDAIDDIMTVSETDVESFRMFSLHHPQLQAIGDTRYDQVSYRSLEAKKRHIIQPGIVAGKMVIVVGSSWSEDEEVVIPAFLRLQESLSNLLLIVVPHEPTIDHIEELEAAIAGKTSSIRFSGLNEYHDERVIIVDSVGILLILYAYAHVAYVGGSFRQGIHNVLEAAVFGVPVVFGPRHRNSQEPLQLVDRGGGFVVNNSEELYRTLDNLLHDDLARTAAGEKASRFVQSNVGATTRFLKHLEPYLMQGPGTVNAHPGKKGDKST